MSRRYVDASGHMIPAYAMPIEKDTGSLANAAYLKSVADGAIPADKPPVTTTNTGSLTNVGYINTALPTETEFAAPGIDQVGIQSLVNIGTANKELGAAIISVESVELDPPETTNAQGELVRINVTLLPLDATYREFTAYAEDDGIAWIQQVNVEENFVSYRANRPGDTSVIVTSKDGGKQTACLVTVVEA